MASLVQDVWLGWEPRLRGRRLALWESPRVRLLFHLDAGSTLDDPRIAALLDRLGGSLEVVAWEPRGQAGSSGRLGTEALDDARRLVAQESSRWGDLPLVVAGHGLGGWLALTVADSPGVVAAAALVLEGRERPAADAEAVSAWLAREPRASRVQAASPDASVLEPPWPGVVAAWAEAAGTAAGEGPA